MQYARVPTEFEGRTVKNERRGEGRRVRVNIDQTKDADGLRISQAPARPESLFFMYTMGVVIRFYCVCAW